MKYVHLATGSLNLTPLDFEGNFEIIKSSILEGRARGAELVLLPELSISGYGCEDMFFADWVFEKSLEYLDRVRELGEGLIIVLGCPFKFEDTRYNTAVVICDKRLVGIVPKQNLAYSGVYYENRWFKAWPGGVLKSEVNGSRIPFGNLIFEVDGIRFGIEICEDAWVSNRPFKAFSSLDVSLVLNPSASHFSFNKLAERLKLVKKAEEIKADVKYAYSNLLGNEAGRLIYDGGAFISSSGEILSSTRRFSFKDFELADEVLELEEVSTSVKSSSYEIVSLDFKLKANKPNRLKKESNFSFSKEEEFTLAVSLSLFDYLRKSRHKAYVVSLSGGADSSACAVLSKLALELAIKDRGEEAVRKMVSQNDSSKLDFSKALICVYLATKYSSDQTFNAAKALAVSLGASFYNYSVDKLVEGYVSSIENDFGSLSWDKNDIPLQNIQARTRGPLVWLIANLVNGLLLSTSNRSEAAVGYTTMDGDTCGGISPIGGINKSFLLKWLSWISDSNNHSFGDFSALKLVLENKPTAELRPRDQNQSDEADLMPYEILDFIEQEFLINRLNRDMLVGSVEKKFSVSVESAREMVDKFLRLWSRNQWKRERYAPSFHLDEENLDPKTWCRYPILSGSI